MMIHIFYTFMMNSHYSQHETFFFFFCYIVTTSFTTVYEMASMNHNELCRVEF